MSAHGATRQQDRKTPLTAPAQAPSQPTGSSAEKPKPIFTGDS